MIYNREINGVKFTIECESWSTRSSWGHEVTLYKNAVKIGRAKVRYYNRTWECYQYQSAIRCVISQAINEIKAVAQETFKTLHHYKVLTKKRAAEFAKYLANDQEYTIYNELYKMF